MAPHPEVVSGASSCTDGDVGDQLPRALKAVATRCAHVSQLAVRGDVGAAEMEQVAALCGRGLSFLDLSGTTIDDSAMQTLAAVSAAPARDLRQSRPPHGGTRPKARRRPRKRPAEGARCAAGAARV